MGIQSVLANSGFYQHGSLPTIPWFAYLGAACVVDGATRLLRRRWLWFWLSLAAILLAALLLDQMIPMPQVSQIPFSVVHARPSTWRTLEDWQKAELAPIIEQYPNNTLRVVVTSSAPDETLDYANQLKDFIGAHKWKAIGPETAATDQIAQNIQLSISEQYVGKKPEAFAAVESQMRFIGLRLRSSVVLDPLVSPNELVMWVGPDTPAGFPQHPPLILGMASTVHR